MTATSDRIEAHVWWISFVVVIGSMMSILDTTIVNVALATLGRELHSSIAEIQWVVTAYMLALAAVIPVSGWAAERFGSKQMYLLSVVLFTAGSILCGIATDTTQLVVFRVLQGVGGGMILPLGQMIMAEAAGPKRMGRVMSIVAVPVMLAPIIGPTIGGVILQNMSWRWIFFVNVPIGVLAVISAIRVLEPGKAIAKRALDFRGLGLMVTGFPLLTYGLAEIGVTGGFGLVKVVLPCLVGLGLIALFTLHSLRARNPLLNVRLYRRPTFSTASVAMFLLSAALFGGMVLMPLYWQNIRHESVIDTGLLVGPQGLGAAVVMPLAGKLTDRIGGGPLCLLGIVLTTIATVPFAMIGAHTSIAYLSVTMFVRGVGIGFAFMPAMTAAFAALDRSELADATPQLNVLQRVGGSLGTAVLAVVLQRALVGAHTLAAGASAYGVAFWASTAMTAVAIIPCVVLMRAERAARVQRAREAADDREAALEAAAA